LSSELVSREGLSWVCFSDWGVVHGTSTRLGGRSQAPYDGLNLGKMSGDDLELVAANRELFGRALGLPIWQNLSMSHGVEVVHIQDPAMAATTWPGDACITAHPEVSLSLTTADCVPIFFWDPEARAVGLAHAGWRGTLNDIAGATVRAMQEHLQAKPERLRVALGPAIGPCCFEVGPEVIEEFSQVYGPADFIAERHIDLHAANRYWLEKAGVRHMEACDWCTSCRADLFYSYRRDGGKTGRLLSVIGLAASQQIDQ
jgi:YfiH family protein